MKTNEQVVIAPLQPAENKTQKRPQSLGQVRQDHEVIKRSDQRDKRDHAAQDHQDQGTAEDRSVRALIPLPVCLLLLLGARQADDLFCHETAFLFKKGAA